MISVSQARQMGLKIVFENPAGVGPTEIGKKILAVHSDMADANGKPNGTIRGGVWDLDRKFPALVRKTDTGFAPVNGARMPDAASSDKSAERKKNGKSPARVNVNSDLPNAAAGKPGPDLGPIQETGSSEIALATQRLRVAALEDAVESAHKRIREFQVCAIACAGRVFDLNVEDESEVTPEKIQAVVMHFREEQKSAAAALVEANAALSKWQDIASNASREAADSLTRAGRLQAELDKGEPERIGVLAEAENGTVLVDIRMAVLAGSDEGTLEAVQRVVADLSRVRTHLALTGIKDDAKRLKTARELAGVSQKVLGYKLDFSGRSVIDLIERGMVPLAKHPKVKMWVEKIEAKHAQN